MADSPWHVEEQCYVRSWPDRRGHCTIRQKSDLPAVSSCPFVSLGRLHSLRNLRQGSLCYCCIENNLGIYSPENYGHRQPEELAGGDGNSWGSHSCPEELTLRSTLNWDFHSCSDIQNRRRDWRKVSFQNFFHIVYYQLKRTEKRQEIIIINTPSVW